MITSEIYDRQNQIMSFTRKLHPFPDIYFCMDNIMGKVKKDILFAYFGST